MGKTLSKKQKNNTATKINRAPQRKKKGVKQHCYNKPNKREGKYQKNNTTKVNYSANKI
jgi:hypothetical protein